MIKAIWPTEIRPFDVHILPLDKEGTLGYEKAVEIYNKLTEKGYDCLFDDRNESAGVKFKDADLIGIRNRIIVGKKASEGIFEYKDLAKDGVEEIDLNKILEMEF